MVREGWGHTFLYFKCRVAWPKLPGLIQRALNASNKVATLPNEIETMKTAAEYFNSMEHLSWDDAANAASDAQDAAGTAAGGNRCKAA